MTERVTVCRFLTKASRSLLGDGRAVSVIGWTPEQSRTGVDLADLGKEENGIGRIGYIFHSSPAVPESAHIRMQHELGFSPATIECETYDRSSVVENGGREEWFDVTEDTVRLVDSVFVLYPDSEETRDLFRTESRVLLEG